MQSPDYSYLGSGLVLMKEYGTAAPFVSVGNCSALSFAPQVNTLQLNDFTAPGGAVRNRVDRINDVQFSLTFHDFNADNFARFLRGTSAAKTAGTATDTLLLAFKGGFTPLPNIASAITSVKAASGNTTYTAGTDYELVNGGLYIPPASAIPNPSGSTANLKVSYQYQAQTTTQALVQPAGHYTLLFAGLNEARSGKPVQITAHKVSGGVMSNLGLIGEEFGAGEVTGSLMTDTAQSTGLSQYFQIVVVD